MGLAGFIARRGLTLRDVAAATGVPISALSQISNRKRNPRTDTVNKILAFVRRYEPKVSYEDLFAPELVRKGVA